MRREREGEREKERREGGKEKKRTHNIPYR
jgi:hypothetical protein